VAPAYTAEDIRFTTKAGALYAFVGAWPESRMARIKSLAGLRVDHVALLGYKGDLKWTLDGEGLSVSLPDRAPSQHAFTLRIQGVPAA
jgi:alpha-L-fucosidase